MNSKNTVFKALIKLVASNILWLHNGSKSKGVFTLVHKHTENLILCLTNEQLREILKDESGKATCAKPPIVW